MPYINQLPLLAIVNPGDQIPVYSPNNGDARRLPMSQLLAYFQSSFASPDLSTNVYTPGTGFNLAVPTPTSNQWILLQPAGTLATGTITLPINTQTPDGTEILITSTQQVTAFTIAANGAANVYGNGLSALSAGDNLRLRFVQSTNSWYRIS